MYVPGWSFGPQKKLEKLQEQAKEGHLYFHSTESCEGGKGAERPSPSPPFDNADPGVKKSPLDKVYLAMEKQAESKPGKVQSKKERGYGTCDERLDQWAEWAKGARWPNTGSVQDSDCPVWPAGWGEQVSSPPPSQAPGPCTWCSCARDTAAGVDGAAHLRGAAVLGVNLAMGDALLHATITRNARNTPDAPVQSRFLSYFVISIMRGVHMHI